MALTNDPQKAASEKEKNGFTLKCIEVVSYGPTFPFCCATVIMAPPFLHASNIFGIAGALDAKMQYTVSKYEKVIICLPLLW